MREKIVDIVVWAVTQIQQDKFDKTQYLLLEQKGYTPKEMSIAFSWLSDRLSAKTPNELVLAITSPLRSFRYFTEDEMYYFTAEAYNTVIKLMSVGLIRAYHIDMIIEKAESMGLQSINNDMVHSFVAYYMFDIPLPEENVTRLNLCGNESIN